MLYDIAAILLALCVLVGSVMLADTAALGFRARRTVTASALLSVTVLVVFIGLLTGTAYPIQWLSRAFTVVYLVIAAYFGVEVAEHDYLYVPLMSLPAVIALDVVLAWS